MSEVASPIGLKQLAEMIEGRPDAEILDEISELGVDSLLDETFTGMASAFRAERAQDENAVIQYDIETPEGQRRYQMVVADRACNLDKGGSRPSRVTLSLSLPNFLRLVTGELDGVQAFMTGALTIQGDLLFSQTMQSWFERSAEA